MELRRRLHREGLRYRIQLRVAGLPRRTLDIAFPTDRLAVFVDGCFWHGCAEHRSLPRSNAEWWADKIASNRSRDRDTDSRLADLGWRVLRFWEHEEPARMLDAVRAALRELRSPPGRDPNGEG